MSHMQNAPRIIIALFLLLAASLLIPKCISYRISLLKPNIAQRAHGSQTVSPVDRGYPGRAELHEAS